MRQSTAHPSSLGRPSERLRWTSVLADTQRNLARLALEVSASGDLHYLAANILDAVIAACSAEAGAILSNPSGRDDGIENEATTLLACHAMSDRDICSALAGDGGAGATRHVVARLPLSGAVSDAPRIDLILTCDAEAVDRARAIAPALADTAGAALSMALLSGVPRQTDEQDERSNMERALPMGKDVSNADIDKDHMTAGMLRTMSHELRSPLATIKGYASTLLLHAQRLETVEQREFLQVIDEATDRLSATIARILDYSEIESGAVTLRPALVDVVCLAREALDARSESHHADILFILAAGEAPTMDGTPRQQDERLLLARVDPRRLRQALDNLLDNAVQYSPRGGEIVLSLRREPADEPYAQNSREQIHIVLRDQGMGIPASELAAIFRDFHRVDARLTRESAGLGLGLSIAKRIVEMHGGHMWAESAQGQGSALHLTLPAWDGDRDAQ